MVENLFTLLDSHADAVVAAAVCGIAWIGAEYAARRSTWRQGAPRRPSSRLDRGTYPLIAAGLVVGMLGSVLAFEFGIGGYLSPWWIPAGVALVALGLGVRGWALRSLGRFFTMPITLPPDQQIVRSGPYRWLRHPAYTGGYLTAVGMPIVLGTPVGAAITIVACGVVYVYRIRIEEAALRTRFGSAYDEYARDTWRLVPGLY